jgi:hypothetical protein
MAKLTQCHSGDFNPIALFEESCRVIFRLACRHGLDHALLLQRDHPTPESFRRACHQGFAEAQALILGGLLEVQDSQRSLEANLKLARRDRNKTGMKSISRDIKLEKLKERILRKLADSIAWHLIGGQSYIARRLFVRAPSRPTLIQSNLESVVAVANRLNADNPLDFALISDLTSFVQPGDILHLTSEGIRVVEVKQGEKNEEAFNEIAKYSLEQGHDMQVDEILNSHPLKDQIVRILRQQRKADQALSLINTGAGNDPATGTPVNVITVMHPEVRYYKELLDLLVQLGPGKDWAFSVLKGGLFIGAYKGVFQGYGRTALLMSAFEEANTSYPVTDLREGLEQPLVEPIFVKPLDEDKLFDIVFGRVSVLLLLRLDHMVELYGSTDVKAEFMSPKQSRKAQAKQPRHQMLMHNKQCIKLEFPNGQAITLGDGIYTRIVFDTLTPECVIGMSVDSIKEDA